MIDFEKTSTEDGISIVSVVGCFEDFSCRYFVGCMDDLLGEGLHEIVIDCEDLGMISSRCLGNLVRAQFRAKRRGGTIMLANVNSSISEMMGVFGLNRLFGIYPTLDAALSKTRRRLGHKKTIAGKQLSGCY